MPIPALVLARTSRTGLLARGGSAADPLAARSLGPSRLHGCYPDPYVHVNFRQPEVTCWRRHTSDRSPGLTFARAPRRRTAGDDEHYRWWALSCTSLGMLLAATNSGTLIIALPDLERSLHTSLLALVWVILAYLIAATVLVLMAGRLSDLFGRKRAYVGGFVLFALRLARRGLRRQRHRADPVAHPAGHRLGVPVRQRRRAGHRRLPAGAARPGDGRQHDGRRHRPGARAGARRRAGGDLLALGVLVQRPARARGRRLGRADPARARQARRGARLRRARHQHLRGRPHRPRARRLARRPQRLEQPDRDRRAGRRGRAAAAVGADRAPLARADARPDDVPQPPVRRRQRRRLHQRPRALRADVPVRLLLPGRPGQLADRRRHQADAAGARDARRLPARGHLRRPPRLARAGRDRDARDRRRAGRR